MTSCFIGGLSARPYFQIIPSRWCTCSRLSLQRAQMTGVAPAKNHGKSRVTREVVAKTARLAHLKFTDEEVDKLTPEFAKMVAFADKMNEIDTSGVDPMARVEDTTNVTRPDVVQSFSNVDGIIDAAPSVERDFIRVPRITSESEG